MTCCIVGLLLLALVGRIRRAFGLVPDEERSLFAPVARRAAPGQEVPEPSYAESAPVRADSPVLRYCALGIAVCLVGYPMLARTGMVVNTGSASAWWMRSLLYLGVLVAAVVLSRSTVIWRAPRGLGALLIVVGAVVFELGALDMHIFRLIAVDSANLLAFMVFHNIGPVLAMTGGAVLLYEAAGRSRTSRRSSRSTVTTARPPSSAVTLSSTPPVTT